MGDNMHEKKLIYKLTITSLFLAIAFILPFFSGQIPEIGQMLCPMHIPILLCGFICGWKWGMMLGLITPISRSLFLSAPPLYPSAIAMSFELATYGFVAGLIYQILPKNKLNTYISLIISMIIGRIVWGISMYILLNVKGEIFTFSSFIGGSLINAIPGIVIQFVFVPLIILAVEKNQRKSDYDN